MNFHLRKASVYDYCRSWSLQNLGCAHCMKRWRTWETLALDVCHHHPNLGLHDYSNHIVPRVLQYFTWEICSNCQLVAISGPGIFQNLDAGFTVQEHKLNAWHSGWPLITDCWTTLRTEFPGFEVCTLHYFKTPGMCCEYFSPPILKLFFLSNHFRKEA